MKPSKLYKETEFRQSSVGKIPKDWDSRPLRDLVLETKSGFASGKRDKEGILQLRMDSIDTEGWINTLRGVKVPIPNDVAEYVLKPGDILFNNTNSVDLIGKTAIFRGEFPKCVYSNHLTRIRTDSAKTVPEWISYQLIRKWKIGVFKSICHRHVHQAGINGADILSLGIPVPRKVEQERIAENLSTVDKSIRKTNEITAKTELLKKGLMQQLLTRGIGHKEFQDTEIGRIPKSWDSVRLQAMGAFQYGVTASANEDDTGIKLLRITDISNGGIDWEKVPNCRISQAEFGKFKLNVGDVLFARIGATTGKTCYVDQSVRAVFGSYLIRFLPKTDIDTKFLYYFAQSELYWDQVNRKKEGQLKKGLNISTLGSLILPRPPSQEQHKIAGILMTVDKKLQVERNKKSKLEKAKQGLMDLLLTGKIRIRVD